MGNLAGYTHYRTVSVTGNKPASSQSWFPMLVAFDTDAGLNDYTQNSGLDIAFTLDGDDTELPYEREEWTDHGANVTARFWVRVPSVDSASDTDLRMHIGKAGGTAYGTPSDTWNENGAGNFRLVHHYATVFTDSTANGNNGTDFGTADIAGIIGRARDFEAGDPADYIAVAAAASINLGTLTIEASVKPESVIANMMVCNRKMANNGTWQISAYDTGGGVYKWSIGIRLEGSEGTIRRATANDTISAGSWYDLAATYDGSDLFLYVNAVLQTITDGTNGAIDVDSPNILHIGSHAVVGADSFDGIIDEFRVSSGARSAAWILFKSDNIFDYAGTITHGAWTAALVPLRRRMESE